MKRFIMAAVLAVICIPAFAGNDNSNPCGNNGNNCGSGAPVANGGSGGNGYGGDASAIGLGVGIGTGGNATANGGSVGDIRNTNSATGGSVLGSGNSHNDNTNIAAGGEGGKGGTGIGFGGSANQAQGQQQGQSQSSVNGQSQGQSSETSTDTSTSTSTAQSQSANNAGNSQSVGGQTVNFRTERNAPPVFLGNVTATVSCAGGVNAGASSQGGSGAFGFTWISADCKQTVVGQNMLAAGKVEMACEIWKATDGFRRAAKRNPALAELSCK